jgi:hypothetical protein
MKPHARANRYHLLVVVQICSLNATCFHQNFCSAHKIFSPCNSAQTNAIAARRAANILFVMLRATQ